MSKRKIEHEERMKIIIDMNDFLITYAKSLFGDSSDLAQKVYDAGKNDITGLDSLFNDSGYGRKERYYALAHGFVVDFYHEDPKAADEEANQITKEAMQYLGKHLNEFNTWAKS
ncbi:hypothetical protein R4B61_03330 [Fructilactobacillus vespulae]|uniref:hypothetical protein n=1 Tax=Fructilactobacillus vespulae TaxID=1249630 RepID=UPI0039B4082F